ncbi:MAG: CDP-glycerol glycerophosphotransferase family protein, partial [Verrucomicrobiae bacterium]|nr:CDP-glycerol glycerophosphotransferase family protein [Verrucomicrobiae bacterium]
YMYQNTIKRFDLCFAAGEAARERLASNVSHYDVARRVLLIGRPQILDTHQPPDDFPASGLTRVLYAPTWEGVTRATRYSSIASHGPAIVRSLLDHGGYQVIYRPHPLSGTRDTTIRLANQRILRMLRETNAALPAPVHYADSSSFGWQLDAMDVMITDISAVAYDWLATGKALMLTRPVEPEAVIGDFRLIRDLPPMEASDAGRAAELAAEAMGHATSGISPLVALLHHYYGQRTECDDSRFQQAVRHAAGLQVELETKLCGGDRGLGGSRHATRVRMQKLNVSIRRLLKIIGVWDPDRAMKRVRRPVDRVHVHFSTVFELAAPQRALSAARESPDGDTPAVMVAATNHVLTYFHLKLLSALDRLRPGRKGRALVVLPISTATACETMVRELAPREVVYLKHHYSNHMMQRVNGPKHTLFLPETDRRFEPERALVNYDEVVTGDPGTLEFLAGLLEISRPVVRDVRSAEPV